MHRESVARTSARNFDNLDVTLAVRCKADLVTADASLAHALAAYLPVKWLGSV
ncbi:MAG TPA: hypothetical protein VKO18_13200 [Terriglobia bacterium]|nr:hypothetical protein [Terriglobia bacterium]